MIAIVDDERTYAELFCENLARVLVNNKLIPDENYRFSYQNRNYGYIILLNNFNEAIEFIINNIDLIDFITFDIMMTLPSGIEELIYKYNTPYPQLIIEEPNALEAGAYLFNMLVANDIIADKLNRFAIITHLKDYAADKLIEHLHEDLRPPVTAFENRILQKNYNNVYNDVYRIVEFLKEEKIETIRKLEHNDE
ncbi:MAG TPA: hypothetical protein PKW95_05470 [bacterium]|nr:hypothetical protein [bacterium]